MLVLTHAKAALHPSVTLRTVHPPELNCRAHVLALSVWLSLSLYVCVCGFHFLWVPPKRGERACVHTFFSVPVLTHASVCLLLTPDAGNVLYGSYCMARTGAYSYGLLVTLDAALWAHIAKAGHEEQDMKTFIGWGASYVKVDRCFGVREHAQRSTASLTAHVGTGGGSLTPTLTHTREREREGGREGE